MGFSYSGGHCNHTYPKGMETKLILYKSMRKKPKKRRSKFLNVRKLTKELVKTYPQIKANLDEVFNAYIRKRDGKCLMGEMWGGCGGYLTCGHVIPKAGHLRIRWDERNAFGQCGGHNKAHVYDNSRYNAWFYKNYGHDLWDELFKLGTQEPDWKPKRSEIEALTKHFQDKLDKLP